MNFQIIYITTTNLKEAEKIASYLLEKKLCACANIIDGMTSMFFWNGKVQKEKETLLLVKTRGELLEEIIKVVKKKHSYECPCIISFPIKDGNRDFLDWIETSTEYIQN